MSQDPLHVMFLGLRDIDGGQGGVENHVAHIAKQLVKRGVQVTVLARRPYSTKGAWQEGLLSVVPLYSPQSARFEAIVHSMIGVLYAALKRPDILHIQGIGPSIVTPFARLLGLRVVTTHHGKDYDREKWGRLAKFVLRMGEKTQVLFSNVRVVISETLRDELAQIYPKYPPYEFIPNGAPDRAPSLSDDQITKWNLSRHRYILNVSRIVPEKRQIDLVRAFREADLPKDIRLVLVGAADHDSSYGVALRNMIGEDERIIQTGFVCGEPLYQFFSFCGLFVLPSSHEGLPISLIEAMTFGCPIIATDIPGNLELNLGERFYVSLDSNAELSMALSEHFAEHIHRVDWKDKLEPYDWSNISLKTLELYRGLLKT
ncbi:glycosyltransferase family 4 protein [Phaeobacter sp. CNT1-3]|nr:glycosyltransferase family 4 protein [Phaeobacter sp. CNT1-3]